MHVFDLWKNKGGRREVKGVGRQFRDHPTSKKHLVERAANEVTCLQPHHHRWDLNKHQLCYTHVHRRTHTVIAQAC